MGGQHGARMLEGLVAAGKVSLGQPGDDFLFCLGMDYMEGPLSCYREEMYHIG